MKQDIDCRIFGDQLDALMEGTLPDEGGRQLRLHALECPECAMQLRVHEHLATPPLEELEAAVPEELLASVWPGVEAETRGRRSGRASLGGRLPWLMPTMAAASVALLVATGLLSLRLERSQAREMALQQQVGALERSLVESSRWVERTEELAGGRRNRARALTYALAGMEQVTPDALLELLARYPRDMVLFDASQVAALSQARSRPPAGSREILAILNEALATLGDAEGVRVGELAAWLESAGLPRDLAVPKSTLIEILS